MVAPEKQQRALHALHQILIHTRTMALEEAAPSRVAEVMDWAELLPIFLAAGEDMTQEFRNTLVTIAKAEPDFAAAVTVFDCSEPVRWLSRRRFSTMSVGQAEAAAEQ